MFFNLTEEQQLIQQAARDFAEKEALLDVIERDEKGLYPYHHINRMKELGFFGMTVDPNYGGGGFDTLSYILVIEELSKHDASLAVILSVHNSIVCWGLENFGTEEQKHKYLVPLAKGEKIGAFLLSEPEAGSDASMQKTIAEDKGDYYLVNGLKNWITSASTADIYILIAQSRPELKHKGINAFIIERNTNGITVGPHENKMGMRSSDTHSVMFTDVKIPKENRIGDEGFGFKFAMKCLEVGRIGIAAQALGIAEGAYLRALKYSKERKTFGVPICQHQAIAFKLAEMATKIEAARLLVYNAAQLKDQKKPIGLISAMAKKFCSDVAMEVTTEAIQIHGGYGYVKEYHVERLFREAKLTQIYEGTSEIQNIVISKHILQ
mgnify:CR=1 FL=1